MRVFQETRLGIAREFTAGSMNPPGLSVVIAEHQLLAREAMEAVCASLAWCRVCASTCCGDRAIEYCLGFHPDALILDLELQDMSGFEVIESLAAAGIRPRILATSLDCDHYTLVRALRARVEGFVDKTRQGFQSFVTALESLRLNRRFRSDRLEDCRRSDVLNPVAFTKVLSRKEEQLLCLIGRGLTDGEVARFVGVSEHTARNHRMRIMHKLGTESTPKLMAYAIGHGFSKPAGLRIDRTVV